MSEKTPISPNGPVAPVVVRAVSTAEEMRSLGRSLSAVLRPGDLVILSGGLGAGKTTLTQGIGEGLGVRGPITSPTFVIARVHPPLGGGVDDLGSPGAARHGGRPPLVHVDAYRLGSAVELDDLDLDTDTESSVTVVEWGEGLAEGLSADRLEITITAAAPEAPQPPDAADPDDGAGDVPRIVRAYAVGERWEGINLPLAGLADRL